jgi:Family of unknown function (DUF6526)
MNKACIESDRLILHKTGSMKQQNFENHVRVYPMHHLVFYPVTGLILTLCVAHAYRHPETRAEWIAISILLMLIIWLSFMLRQHYALNNQNRIVRLELRLRYFQLTGKRFESVEKELTLTQIVALRFAADDELPGLIERTVREHLNPSDIKRSVKSWQADHIRV